MRLTWTFYPKEQQKIDLVVNYLPALDRHNLPQGGYLLKDQNTAFVDWKTFKLFSMPEIEPRKQAYQRLIVAAKPNVKVNDEIIKLTS